MKRVNLLLGGPQELWPQQLKKSPTEIAGDWIGVDRGTLFLLKMGIQPKISVGDYDSLSASELDLVKAHIQDIYYEKPEKDDTDSELGLKLALEKLHADSVTIYGATGGRLDHFLVNFFMLLEPRFRTHAANIVMVDQHNHLSFYLPGKYEIRKQSDKKYLAFVAMTPVQHLTIHDAKYQLHDAQLDVPVSYASNEFVNDTVHFQFESGTICVIQSTDQSV
ncbi:thiamine diphosphokinase [Lactobacillus sp. CC-MHH1034]|uniref:thiamine diphosphokinase n=1 Tax=Agrilactobacillus fermenti TaxID=2586909 RepID=UPI001E44819E|nr:thiamine diphosphokinase [Agrilactobacillus fermenti]MCD2256226.1 thiamine diphosphokinase [Agrilactobacillus fermenti]